jgi:hypothetical protein
MSCCEQKLQESSAWETPQRGPRTSSPIQIRRSATWTTILDGNGFDGMRDECGMIPHLAENDLTVTSALQVDSRSFDRGGQAHLRIG